MQRRAGSRRMPEHRVQANIVRSLRGRGYVVMVCGTRARPARGFTCQTPGLPDLYVLPPTCKQGAWFAFEVKAEGGRVRPAQLALIRRRAVHVVHNTGEALAILERHARRRVALTTPCPACQEPIAGSKCMNCGYWRPAA